MVFKSSSSIFNNSLPPALRLLFPPLRNCLLKLLSLFRLHFVNPLLIRLLYLNLLFTYEVFNLLKILIFTQQLPSSLWPSLVSVCSWMPLKKARFLQEKVFARIYSRGAFNLRVSQKTVALSSTFASFSASPLATRDPSFSLSSSRSPANPTQASSFALL